LAEDRRSPAPPPLPGNLSYAASELDELRRRIEALDERLVELLADRSEVVGEIASLKRRHNLPIHHPAREEDLISRRRAQARGLGLDPEHVDDLFRRIFRQSRHSQAGALPLHGLRPGAKVLLVGGQGSMGQCFGRWFRAGGYEVRVLDRDDWDRLEELSRDVELALLSVPIRSTPAVAERLGSSLPASCVLADLTSVKVAPLGAMLAAHPGPVLGLHPMFGPIGGSPANQIVVATPGRDEEACRWVLDQLAAWGAVIVQASAEEHDEAMAVVQALRHFATFAFGRFLATRGVDLARTLEFSSPIYRLELAMVGRLFAQDPDLYADIILATPERRELLRGYVGSLQESLGLLEGGGRDAWVAEFRRVAEWFGPFGEQAVRESEYLIEKMVERF
jgi:chorismate mutase / prephenate dehydrogenase